MKSFFKKLVSRVVRNDRLWKILDSTVIRASQYAELTRRADQQRVVIDPAIHKFFPDLRVEHGPFRGLKYPQAQSINSALFPKLLGSYERELEQILEKICRTKYSEIVDVGCAEGYYAVGLALRIPSAKVFAYDSDPAARAMCQELADLNGVRSRIAIGSFCDGETLQAIPFTRKGLIFSDCEGYEKELFTPEVVSFLSPHDVLIETHDLVDIEISQEIRRRFKTTHVITAVQSIDDITKAHTYSYEELRNHNLSSRKILLAEDRAVIQEWLFMTPRRKKR